MKEKGVSKQDILMLYEKPRGREIAEKPHLFWSKQFGLDTFQTWFTDLAAHHSTDIDYVSREDFNFSKKEYLNSFRPSNGLYKYNPLVWENTSQGWLDGQEIRGWGYDVWIIPNPGDKLIK